MQFRAIDSRGAEIMLENAHAVIDALARGVLAQDSMLFDAMTQRWSRLGDHDIYAAFLASAGSRDFNAADVPYPQDLGSAGPEATIPGDRGSSPALVSAAAHPPW